MSVRLDSAVSAGGAVVCALVEVEILAERGPGLTGAAQGWKRPLALLIHAGGHTRCFAPDGTMIDPEAFEARYPGQRAAFEAGL